MQVHFLNAALFTGGLAAILELSMTIPYVSRVVEGFDRHFDPPLFPSELVLGYENTPTTRRPNRKPIAIYADVVVILTTPYGSSANACKIARALTTRRFGPKACLMVSLGGKNAPVTSVIPTLHDPDIESLIEAIISAYSLS
ncbi:hypothetical protein HOI83_01110 [Candidatus Uhrbacteria bacterium]|jgi:hypothetical protein|nr:hypothetical protein [Candidatus Uhrbacteria bacterium]